MKLNAHSVTERGFMQTPETDANKIGAGCVCGKFPRLGSSMPLELTDGSSHSTAQCTTLPEGSEDEEQGLTHD